MSEVFKIKIPLTSVQAPKTFIDDLANVSPKLINNYYNYFEQASISTNVPISVLLSIAMVESTGNHYTKSKNVYVSGSERSVGLMQISPASFYEALKTEIAKQRLSTSSILLINKYLPNFKYSLGKSIPPSPSTSNLNMFFEALKNIEFNILASAIVFRKLLEQTANSDMTMRLDKAIVKYNIGEYTKLAKTDVYINSDTTTLMREGRLPNITINYIAKAVGRKGAMEFFILKGY